MHVNIDEFKHGDSLRDHQTVKLKSQSNFPATRYVQVLKHAVSVSKR